MLGVGYGAGNRRDIYQNVRVSPENSSIIPLVSGGVFVGTGVSTLGVVGIQVSLKTDTNCLVYIEQSPDNINWDLQDVYNYYASINNFGITVTAINSYVRVRVENNSLINQTYLRLQTVLCPIVEALPRSLDENGHLLTAVHVIKDEYGFGVENTPMGEMRAIEPVRLVGTTFVGTTVDTNFWTPTVANGGTVTSPGNELVLRTNGAANGSAIVNSVRSGRYVGGSSNRYRAVLRLPDVGAAGNIRRWGVFTATDGAFFELNEATFRVVTRKGGVDTAVASGAFNGELGAIFVPGTNARTFEIYWTNTRVYFVVADQILHVIEALTATWTATSILPIRAENVNSGGAANDLQLLIRVQTIYRLGKAETRPIWRFQDGAVGATVLKYGAGTLHRVTIGDAAGTSIELYDSTGGLTSKIAFIDPSSNPVTLEFNLDFYNGLTIVAVGAVKATIIYE